jgi:hypothetical protein
VPSVKRPLLALVFALLALSLWPLAAQANKGDHLLASYCSPSGDYCTGVVKNKGEIYLTLRTFAFHDKYKVCVDPAGYRRECGFFFSLSKGKGGVYASREKLDGSFPDEYAGQYKVTWYHDDVRLGRPLSFSKSGKQLRR